ncbi:MAG: RNA 3'-terminal phosphate cyclase [Candidatus Zixiibacteriota bacterium]
MSIPVEIDGSFGEGGGQILRTSLAISLVTRQPFRITKIRAGRKKPGLLHQHLTSVKAASAISQAEVKGDYLGSQELYFTPKTITPGQYHLAVGTAGSCTLVLQTVLPALLTAGGRSELRLEGGTHNPFAPPFDFLVKAFLPIVNRMGPRVTATLKRPGFYPVGGGEIKVSIEPAAALSRIDLLERGKIKKQLARAMVARLPRSIGERELKVVQDQLAWDRSCLQVEQLRNSRGPGNTLIIEIESENITEVFTGFGQKGVPAEKVADKTVREVQEYLATGVPVGKHLADQLLIPMTLANGGKFRTLPLTDHTTTNIQVLKQFLGVEIKVLELTDNVREIHIRQK